MVLEKTQKRIRRKARARAKVFGSAKRPRLCVFKSNKNIYLQMINDEKGETILSASSLKLENSKKKPSEISYDLGKEIGEKAIKNKISECVFDRGGFPYIGKVAEVARGARESGLKF